MCGLGPASADWPLDFLWKMFNSCDLLSAGFLLTIKSISILLAHRTNGRWVVQLSCYLPKRSSRKPLDEALWSRWGGLRHADLNCFTSADPRPAFAALLNDGNWCGMGHLRPMGGHSFQLHEIFNQRLNADRATYLLSIISIQWQSPLDLSEDTPEV